MSDIHITSFGEASQTIRAVPSEIDDLATACDRVGDMLLARELREAVQRIDSARDVMDQAFSTELDRGFKQAQQSSATMLEAVFAGVQIGKEAPDAST